MAHNLKSFIEKVLISEIKKIQQTHGHHYLSFSLISQGIEFLGACLDCEPFHTDKEASNKLGNSQRRFQRAIKDLFPNKYKSYNNKGTQFNLYENLRCGLVHVLLPKKNIELIQNSETNETLKHLAKVKIRGKERLVLVSEDLFADFEKACKKVIMKYEKNELNGNSISEVLIETDLNE